MTMPNQYPQGSWAQIASSPQATPEQLRQAIQADISTMALVAVNPSVDEPLREWLWQNGGDQVQQAMVEAYNRAVAAQQEPSPYDAPQAAGQQPETLDHQLFGTETGAGQQYGGAAADQGGAGAAQHESAQQDAVQQSSYEASAGQPQAQFYAQPQQQPAASSGSGDPWVQQAAQPPVDGVIDAVPGLDVAPAETPEPQQPEPAAVIIPEFSKPAEAQPELQQTSADPGDDDVDKTVFVKREVLPKAHLEFETGESVEITNSSVLLGRNPRSRRGVASDAQVVRIPDPEKVISKRHALLDYEAGAWYITDLASTNGTTVTIDGEEVELSPKAKTRVEGPFKLGFFEIKLVEDK